MASHIPLAVSLFQSMASGLSKAQAASIPPHSIVAPPPPIQRATIPLPSTAPMSIPGAMPLAAPPIVSTTPANGALGTSPPHGSSPTLCETCYLRPKHSDGVTTHPYCSKTCANKAKLAGNGTSGSVPSSNSSSTINLSGNCEVCHIRPKYNDGTQTHPYCSKACAKNSKARKPNANGNVKLCQAPNCQKPPHANSNGTLGDYCSIAHKTSGKLSKFAKVLGTNSASRVAETICIMCRQTAKLPTSHFCGQACSDEADKKAPMILEIPAGHVTFKSVADQFKASWRHSGTICPPVKRVYKIFSSPANLASYDAYKAAVESRGQFVSSSRSAGNENRRWHGTRRECLLGDKGHDQFCSSQTCSLCCIVRTSFDLSLWGKKTGWGRFGKGIYTSSTSSKSNDYSQNDGKSPLKAILLNKVIVGKGCKLLQDDTSLTVPPTGFDSVLAEKGGSLNYDELVVYTNDAIRPSYLVMYEP